MGPKLLVAAPRGGGDLYPIDTMPLTANSLKVQIVEGMVGITTRVPGGVHAYSK